MLREPRGRCVEHQLVNSVGVRRREQNADRAPFTGAEEDRLVRLDGIAYGPEIVDALSQRRRVHHRVGESRPALVINDKPRFPREWFDEWSVRTRCVVVGIHIANHPSGHPNDEWARSAEDSIRQMHVPVACVAQLFISHVNILASPRSEGLQISLSRSHTATASASRGYGTVTGPQRLDHPPAPAFALVDMEPMTEPMTGIEPAYSAWGTAVLH